MAKNDTTRIPDRYLNVENTDREIYSKLIKVLGSEDKAQLALQSLKDKVHSSNKLEEIINDAITLFPDIELAMEVLTTLIESPNDMQFPNLIYRLENVDLPTKVIIKILDITKDYVTTEYKFIEKISDIIKDTLFYKGAYVEAILPGEDLISLVTKLRTKKSKTKGMVKVSTEDINSESDFDIFSKRELSTFKDNDKIMNLVTTPLAICQEEFNELLYKNKMEEKLYSKYFNFSTDTMVSMEDVILENNSAMFVNDGFISRGKPFIKKIDPATLIPITSSSEPNKHLAYFLILNNKGEAIGNTKQFISQIGSSGNDKISKVEEMLSNVKNKLTVMTGTRKEIKNMDDFRNKYLVEKLNRYLKMTDLDSLVPYNIEIQNDIVVDAMFNIINNSSLQVIFLPAELISYTAVEYRKDGTGKSLLEKVLMLLSIRGIAMFTRILSYVKSSVTTTEVDVTLSDLDDNYRKTMEMIKASVIKNRQVALPIGEINPIKLTDWIHNLGFSFNFKHKNLPEMDIQIDEKAFDINPIDTSLEEDINRNIYNAFYLTPEIISDAMGPDFATTVVANRLLLTKRITKLQSKFDVKFTDNIRKRLSLDNDFQSRLYKALLDDKKQIRSYLKKKAANDEKKKRIENSTDEELLNWIIFLSIKNIKVALPKPESSELEYSSDAVDKFTSLLDSVMDRIFSQDALPDELVDQLGDKIESASSAVKTMLLLRFINEKGIFPELTKLFTLDEDGEPIFNVLEEFNSYTQTLASVLAPFIKSNKKLKEEIDKDLDKAENGGNDNNESDSNENSVNSDNNSSDNENNDNNSDENNDNSDNEDNDNNSDNNNDDNSSSDNTDNTNDNGGDNVDNDLKSLM